MESVLPGGWPVRAVAGEGEDLHDLRKEEASIVVQEIRPQGGDQLAVALEVNLTHRRKHNGVGDTRLVVPRTHGAGVGDEPGEPGLDIDLEAGEVLVRTEDGDQVLAVHLVMGATKESTEDLGGYRHTLHGKVSDDTVPLLRRGLKVALDNLPLTSSLRGVKRREIESRGKRSRLGLLHGVPLVVEVPEPVEEVVEEEAVPVHLSELDDGVPRYRVNPEANVAGFDLAVLVVEIKERAVGVLLTDFYTKFSKGEDKIDLLDFSLSRKEVGGLQVARVEVLDTLLILKEEFRGNNLTEVGTSRKGSGGSSSEVHD